jgi:hypothetical protein
MNSIFVGHLADENTWAPAKKTAFMLLRKSLIHDMRVCVQPLYPQNCLPELVSFQIERTAAIEIQAVN